MKIGDLVETISGPQIIGIIVEIEKSVWTNRWRYWVKMADKDMGAYPFLDNQIILMILFLINQIFGILRQQ